MYMRRWICERFGHQLYLHVSLFDITPHFYIAVHVSKIHRDISGAAKSNHLKLFAVFSATALDFCWKFYLFTWLFYLHLTVKWHLVIFKYDEIIDILARPLSNVCALKNVCAETQQIRVAETTRCTHLVWCSTATATICARIVHRQLLCLYSLIVWNF